MKRKKRKNRKNGNGKVFTTHHIVPQSRTSNNKDCPTTELTVELPKEIHKSWHIIVGNLYGKEIPAFIKEFQKIMRSQQKITEIDIILLREKIKSKNLNLNKV